MIRAAAEHAAAEPVERRALALRVRLALDVPAADAAVELAERSGGRGCAAARGIVRPRGHLRVLRRIPHRARFEHDDIGARFAEHLGRHPAAGAGSDDAHVVDFGLTDDLHDGTGYVRSRFCGKVWRMKNRLAFAIAGSLVLVTAGAAVRAQQQALTAPADQA